ncbi:MAG: AP2 domain-containing protein [Clostridia bacterium]
MSSKVDRIGEKNINNFGSEMVIVEYRKAIDIDIYFPQYDWTAKNKRYDNFKGGKIKCPYEKRYYNMGYLGEGNYKAWENGKDTKVFKTWHHMLERCYSKKCHEKYSTYIVCETSDDFHNFQNFGEWDEDNYYEINGEKMCLDKDILIKGNKIYSSETCIYVPQTINKLFTKSDKTRGKSVIGTSPYKNGKYQVYCCMINPETRKFKQEYLGYYNTEQEAFEVYKYYKEKNIKQIADYYKGKIPDKLYDAMYNYEVEIDD